MIRSLKVVPAPLLAALFLLCSCIPYFQPALATAASAAVVSTPASDDALLALYRDDHFRPLVVEYCTQLTQNRTVALAVLDACDQLGIDPSLALAVAWNESQFNPRAIHENPTTQDRGLFQLNSRSFSHLTGKQVFDPAANARVGLTYLKMALTKLGSDEKALGYYNSGIGMLSSREFPRSTQVYIQRVLEDRQRIDRDAIAFLYFSHETRLALR